MTSLLDFTDYLCDRDHENCLEMFNFAYTPALRMNLRIKFAAYVYCMFILTAISESVIASWELKTF